MLDGADSDVLMVADTSVAIPLLIASHQAHDAISAWAVGRLLGLSGHALAETYSVLTRLPGDARVHPVDAVALIDDNFPIRPVLTPDLAQECHRELARCGVSGGATYDGLVALAAREHGAVLVTRDARARSTYEAVGARVELFTSVGPS
jgi:predicted nucleic acid-binding protein